MKAKKVYKALEAQFDLISPCDDWHIKHKQYVTKAFKNGKNKEMGLMLDNTKVIECAYTATFLSEHVVDQLRKDDAKNAILFVHHAKDWTLELTPKGGTLFTEIGEPSYEFLKQNNISVFVLHAPLDANGPYSTNETLAAALGLEVVGTGLENYRGITLGLICKTACATVAELKKLFEKTIGHKAFLIKNGEDVIKDGLVGMIAGGGNAAEIYDKLAFKGINTYITGVVNAETGYQKAVDALECAKSHKINILAGTHYSTEKFAPMALISFFKELGLSAKFINESPKTTDYTFKK